MVLGGINFRVNKEKTNIQLLGRDSAKFKGSQAQELSQSQVSSAEAGRDGTVCSRTLFSLLVGFLPQCLPCFQSVWTHKCSALINTS